MTKEEILSLIRQFVTENEGRVPGVRLFEIQTGIIPSRWRGVYWSKWSEAIEEAGFKPNKMSEKHDEIELLEHYIRAIRYYSTIPTEPQLKLYRRNLDTSFPNVDAFRNNFGSRNSLLIRLREFVFSRDDLKDLHHLFPETEQLEKSVAVTRSKIGNVYLIKWGKHYKIGRTDNLERRLKEIRTSLPSKSEIVHSIRTDDPSGIEAYWHNRFAERRAENGEWFNLTPSDVQIFKKRTFM